MHLHNEPFMNIKNGTKTIEIRLNDEKRQQYKVHDYIECTNRTTLETMLLEIVNISKYKNFEELYQNYDKVSLGYGKDDQADFHDMEKYYSKEDQEKYGVLGIKIKVKE